MYLVIKATFLIEKFKKCGVSFASPKIEVTDLEITPNWMYLVRDWEVVHVDLYSQWHRL
jgi:hypothetical protein